MNRPWMPLYIGDYCGDTAHLRAAESGAYIHLIMHYWRNEGLPDDDVQLSAIARMTLEEWQRARPLIEPLFKAGPWKHKRVESELAKVRARTEAGRKGGLAKAKQKPSDPPGTPVVVSYETTSQPKGSSSSEDLFGESKPRGSEDTRARRNERATRLPNDWVPTLGDLAFARTILPESHVAVEVDTFRDHWHSANGPPTVKRNWSAAWRNWCRKAVKINGSNGGRNGSFGGRGGAVRARIDLARRAAANGDHPDHGSEQPAGSVRTIDGS